jgi:hypothetical protein
VELTVKINDDGGGEKEKETLVHEFVVFYL